MTNFNVLLTINEIKQAYATSIFPDAMCLLWNKEETETINNIIITAFNLIEIE